MGNFARPAHLDSRDIGLMQRRGSLLLLGS